MNSIPLGTLFLSSDDRLSSEDPNNVNFQFNIPNIKRIGLSSYDIIYSFSNINTNNNLGFFETMSQTFPVTIPYGYYTYTTLASQLQTILNTLGTGTWTVTYTNYVFIVTNTSAIQFRFITNPTRTAKDWVDMMGFQKDISFSTQAFSSTADITYTNKLFIKTDFIGQDKTQNDYTSNLAGNNILGIVYVNSNRNSGGDTGATDINTPHHCTEHLFNIKWIYRRSENSLSSFNISILDDNGVLVPKSSINSGSLNWSLELFYEV